jgi:hypothetical protein
MRFELSLGRRMRMFPFHTLAFILWLIMVCPCFVFLDDSVQEMVTVNIIAIQKQFSDVQIILFVQFFELLKDPSCTDFMEGKAVMDNFVG